MSALLISISSWFILFLWYLLFTFPLRNSQLTKKKKRFCYFDLCLRLALYEDCRNLEKLARNWTGVLLRAGIPRGSGKGDKAPWEIFTKQHLPDSVMVSHLLPIVPLRISFNEPLLLKECVIFLVCVRAEINLEWLP